MFSLIPLTEELRLRSSHASSTTKKGFDREISELQIDGSCSYHGRKFEIPFCKIHGLAEFVARLPGL